MTTTYKATIGTISHGTLRAEDLIPAFLDELNRLKEAEANRIRALYPEYEDAEEDDDFWQDGADDMVNDLQDALNAEAPAYCYFGSLEGDGSDFGFWPIGPRDIDDAEVLKVSQTPEYILQVNDHGNATLYKVTLEEVWSIV